MKSTLVHIDILRYDCLEVMMSTIEIYDPAMCCSSGVCGEDVDQTLVDVAAAVSAARDEGIDVVRHNLANSPADFAAQPAVRELLEREGAAALPVVMIGDEVVLKGVYPTLGQLRAWVNREASDVSAARAELPIASSGSCCKGSGCC